MRQSAPEMQQDAAPQGRLAELLACERELAELLEAVRAEAARRVEVARAEAERAEAELEASLEQEAERVRREVHDVAQARVHELSARAREQAARFETRSEDEVEWLAASAFRRLLGMEESA